MTMIQQTQWYLIYTKAKQEFIAQDNLERQGYEIYFPRIRQLRKRRSKVISLIDAAFPRYLFIKLTSGVDNWSPIRSTQGVSNLVKFGNVPASVPEFLINSLKQREDDDGIQKLTDAEFKKGDKLHIVDGLLAGCEAKFTTRSGLDRVVVLLDIMGKYTTANIMLSDLELS